LSTLDLPVVNAFLNGTSFVLLLNGWIAIRRGNIERHRRFMVSALVVSVLFLITYLTYHSLHGSTKFGGEGASRPLYFTILLSHTVLAASLVWLVPWTVSRAVKGQLERHVRWARWLLPIWMYVSITGVLIYLMLYVWFTPLSRGPS
jgi:uncharacterized membrane protein YozB (DUF420 family)